MNMNLTTSASYNTNGTYNGMARLYSQQHLITSNIHTMANTAHHTTGVQCQSTPNDTNLQLERPNCRHHYSNNGTASVSLHPLAGHAVDDAVSVRIHKPDGIWCEPQTEAKSQTWPEENVEYCGVIFGIMYSQIQFILHKQQCFRLTTTVPG